MDRQRVAERDQQIARIREIFESTKDQETEPEIDPEGASSLLGDDLGPVARAPRARVRLLIAQRPAVAYAAVAIAAAVVAAAVTWMSRPTSTPIDGATAPSQIAAVDEQNDETAGGDASGGSSSAVAESEASPASIVVSVVGNVAAPGLVTLTDGARVSDAIAAAGGALPGVDLTTMNLARKVVDGEQIAVGIPAAADAGTPQEPATGSGDSGGGAGGGGALVNVNSATAAQLEALPGIGPVLAQSIVDYREQNGPFENVEDLSNVSGIGPATLAKLKDLVTV